MKNFCLLPSLLSVSFLVLSLQAANPAFWNEYNADKNTYLLIDFQSGKKSDATGKKLELLGDAEIVKSGKFGEVLNVSGAGAVKVIPEKIFAGSTICVEGWVKLTSYPKKRGYIVYRQAVVDKSVYYDPKKDLTKGFSLYVDNQGALHFEVISCGHGRITEISSKPGVVPLNKWVHLAGMIHNFPIMYKRLYLDGKMIAHQALANHKGIITRREEEKEPGPIFIGAASDLNSGIIGEIDKVRVHSKILKFFPKPNNTWQRSLNREKLKLAPPLLIDKTIPAKHYSFEQTDKSGIKEIKNVKKIPGLMGKAITGEFSLATDLQNSDQGTLEFWMAPLDFCNYFRGTRKCIINNMFRLRFQRNAFDATPNPLLLRVYTRQFMGKNNVEFYPDKWRQIIITWKKNDNNEIISYFIDGKPIDTLIIPRKPNDSTSLSSLHFLPGFAIDELYLWPRALNQDEVANLYYRYCSPEKMFPASRYLFSPLVWYFPSKNQLRFKVRPAENCPSIKSVNFVIKQKNGKTLLNKSIPFTNDSSTTSVSLPSLKHGEYNLTMALLDSKEKVIDKKEITFKRHHFDWEKNNLGITDEIYPPLKPIKVKGNRAQVVLREYEMNNFGLWKQVVANGKPLLAAPMTIKYETANSQGKWEKSSGKFVSTKPNLAIYECQSESSAINISSKSSIEEDGCMKVEMTMAPGTKPSEINKLWIEIPLKSSEAKLFNEYIDRNRANRSGKLPKKRGVIWKSSEANLRSCWQNAFVTYLWLGNANRGLAWFAGNDKGWITRKKDYKTPIQEVVREKNQVIMRIYLINKPAVIKKKHQLVFGLQASPTKPMPENWRQKAASRPGGLPTYPWGGQSPCSMKPWRNDWKVVDKIVESRKTGKVDKKWFNDYDAKNNPPPVFGIKPWLTSVLYFSKRCSGTPFKKPISVYHEELAASVTNEDWKTFQDEWGADLPDTRDWPDESMLRQGIRAHQHREVNFCRSYRDFGVWHANEWLKRGVGLYWDRTWPKASTNYYQTNAYVTEDGSIQPCVTIWNHRNYHKRCWNLMQQWRRKGPAALEWTIHKTSNCLLPMHTWSTVSLDGEHPLRGKIAPPDWIRANAIGSQIGDYPLFIDPVYGTKSPIAKKMSPYQRYRSDWGMRMVHELGRKSMTNNLVKTAKEKLSNPEKIIQDFGYEDPKIIIHNYWADQPVLKINDDQVKWLAMENPETGQVLIILASWNEKAVPIKLTLGSQLKKYQSHSAVDAETLESIPVTNGTINCKLPGPYGTKIIKLEKKN